ncbi:MAG TPA: M23 family metallopeptidase [Treponemataceae bacterium]|nr:M23 family metallopeptidase [Treponemataceae bacterium]
MKLTRLICRILPAVVICTSLIISCNSKEISFSEVDILPTLSEEFTGMGGADGRLPSERPGIEQEDKIEQIELYYTTYTVQKGDIVGAIAKTHNVSQDSIISLNKLRNTRTLQIGQILKIPSIDGIVYTAKKGDTPGNIADKYQISLEKVALVNNISDNTLTPGALLFLPDAKLDWVTIQEINGDLFLKPLKGSYYISSRYGWRDNPFSGYRTFHNGIDMATSRGTSVYAALDGTVSRAGYDVTYGNYIIISHHSGYQTMYAHLNTILTTRGKYVTSSTRIGTVGNTGQSTGPHLHFTVYKNNATINPASLWN